MPCAKVRFLGISVNPLTREQLLEFFTASIEEQARVVVGTHNMHSAYLAQSNRSFREFYDNCNLVYVDGMFLVWIAQALGQPVRAEHRVAFLDWYDEFFHLAATRKWRIFYLGGAPESSRGFEDILQRNYPGIQAAVHHGYVRELNVKALCDQINGFKPHALFIGMGMLIQEKFILDALPYLKTNLVFAGGAMLEYLTGEKKAAPRWMGPMGLEWIFRLVHEPRRLGYRYLVEPVKLAPVFLRELLQGKTRAGRNFVPKPKDQLGCKSEE